MIDPLVPYRITICGLAELCEHATTGVSHVLTIIDPGFPDPDDFSEYLPHRRTVWRFHDTIREDGRNGTPPGIREVHAILDFGAQLHREAAEHLLIHCHMGISRSTATAAILLAQHNPGREDDAFAHLRAIRPRSWPNSRMIALADALMGRSGALVAAMRVHHIRVAHRHPLLAAILKEGERASEVPDIY